MRKLLIVSALLLSIVEAGHAQEPLFDGHVHLWNDAQSLAAYDAQSKAGEPATHIAAMWFGGPNQALAGNPEAIRAGNDGIISLARRDKRVLPVATVHPYDGAAATAELERVTAQGVKILKIHPHTQRFDAADPRVLALAKRAGELGVILLMDNANILPGDNQKLFNLALAAPKTTFIYAHIGALDFRFWNMLKLARTAENLFANNIYFDISATVILAAGSPIEAEFVWTLRNVGMDQLLLGSDYPQLGLPQTLAALDRLPLTNEEKAAIRYGNAKRLFGL